MTEGEYKVGISFNPSGNAEVNKIKQSAASLIDYLNDWLTHQSGPATNEQGRLVALAKTHIEDAAMWAVKAVTKQPFAP